MRTTKRYPGLGVGTVWPEVASGVSCGTRLRRRVPLSRRVVITQNGPLQLTHCGYRCPNQACGVPARTYRSAVADGLALPGFTFVLDWIRVMGHLRLHQHLTLDQTHQVVQERLARWQVTISRREVLYLFEAYCSLLRAAQDWSTEPPWRAEGEANGGLILALARIQPDKGHETVYLIRDLLTGHPLRAQNLLSRGAATIQEGLPSPLASWASAAPGGGVEKSVPNGAERAGAGKGGKRGGKRGAPSPSLPGAPPACPACARSSACVRHLPPTWRVCAQGRRGCSKPKRCSAGKGTSGSRSRPSRPGARAWRAARAGCHQRMPTAWRISSACSPACSRTCLSGPPWLACRGPTMTWSASSAR